MYLSHSKIQDFKNFLRYYRLLIKTIYSLFINGINNFQINFFLIVLIYDL